MSDYDRSRHDSLGTYPEGEVYFFDNGTFATQYDYDAGIKVTGTFFCGGIKKTDLKVSKKRDARWDGKDRAPSPEFPIPKKERPKNSASGMGVVSISASYISEILKCAKIGGSTLDQNALNQLYDYIKNNK
jgi:hypothetical protein